MDGHIVNLKQTDSLEWSTRLCRHHQKGSGYFFFLLTRFFRSNFFRIDGRPWCWWNVADKVDDGRGISWKLRTECDAASSPHETCFRSLAVASRRVSGRKMLKSLDWWRTFFPVEMGMLAVCNIVVEMLKAENLNYFCNRNWCDWEGDTLLHDWLININELCVLQRDLKLNVRHIWIVVEKL